MKRFLKTVLLSVVVAFGFTVTAHAQATRTWVSGVGDDANPCSRTAPCKTFAGAISKTTSAGEISVLDPGGFGALTITKAITLSGGGELASVLVSGTNGIVVAAGQADTVVLRNIEFTGGGSGLSGVLIQSAGKVIIDHCTFQGFTADNVEIAVASPTYVTVLDSVMTGGAIGVSIDSTSGPGPVVALLKNVTIQGAGVGVQTKRGVVDITRSTIQSNTTYGVYASVGYINLADSTLALNGTGVLASAGAAVAMSNVSLFNNGIGIGSGGGSVQSAGNNVSAGNTTPGAPNGAALVQ
ncbi:right-handed parallel beta-helix repeat-containing protein [Dyella sp. EPa41]|uniref:right-handed parallel beta-helix repeat-containing protein n=1 Tax=Dyella sp. EPa41 TaxID=1561194 RepID=UPI001915F669|nr:right-handed parallel beta-helix repeat-containing protein [Dyella sp. EPa41]